MIFVLSSVAIADEAILPPDVSILDPGLMMYSWPHPTISPDGEWVAYISKGFVCVCNITDPEPRRLREVPHTWTHFLAQPEQAHAKGVFHKTFGPGREEHRAVMAQITNTVFGLQWTHDSEGVVFGVRSYDKQQETIQSKIWDVSIEAEVTPMTRINRKFASGMDYIGNDFHVTRDRKYLVMPRHKRPLIWDLTTNKPRAACFYNLTPSSTSGDWIGIEKDSWQLVITDEDFKITKRFAIVQPARYGGPKLNWSPDERHLIWRNKIGFDHYSNWEGFWMDLETGEKRELSGQFMNQQFKFTGREGEYVCWGATGERNKHVSGAHTTGAYLTLVADAKKPARDLWRTKRPHASPPVRLGPKFDLFAIGLPRPPAATHGHVWHLMDRNGKKWRFPIEGNGDSRAPFEVVGFANGGQEIVAYDTTRLFAIPVKTIQNSSP